MTDERKEVTVIDLYPLMVTCCICGTSDYSRWSVPIDEQTALICANDFDGDWCAKPACRECWQKHDDGQFVGHEPRWRNDEPV